jgi:hypothetical protein
LVNHFWPRGATLVAAHNAGRESPTGGIVYPLVILIIIDYTDNKYRVICARNRRRSAAVLLKNQYREFTFKKELGIKV